MAISGRFQADFAAFYDACTKAEVSLRTFEQGSAKVETSLNRVANSLSGTKLISDATMMTEAVGRVGGAATLTAKEQARVNTTVSEAIEKYTALGQQAPAAMVELEEATRSAEVPTTALSVAVGTLAAQIVTKAASAFTAYGKEALLTSARVESLGGVARFMGQQAGVTAGEVDALAGALQRQGITTGQSYDAITQMIRGNISLASATDLATVAQSLARASGENSSATLGKLIQGVQTLSSEQLKGADVILNFDQEYRNFIGTSDRTVASLGVQEKQQIILAAVMREGERVAGLYGESNEFLGGKIQSMARHQEEAAKAIGDVFQPALKVGVDWMTAFLKVVQEAPATFGGLGLATVGLATAFTAFKGAAALGVIGTVAAGAAIVVLGKAALVAAAAFAAFKFLEWTGLVHVLSDAVEWLAGRMMGLTTAEIEAGRAAREYAESAAGKTAALKSQAEALARLEQKGRENEQAARARAEAESQQAMAAAAAAAAAEKAAQEAAAAAKKYAEALEELHSAGVGWQGTLATINGKTLDAVRGYLEAGVSQGALATAYGLTATQMKAVTAFMADQEKQHKRNDAAIAQTIKLWNEYDSVRAAQGATATDMQIAEVHRWAADLTAQMQKAGTDTEEFYTALAATTAAKLDGLAVDWGAVNTAMTTSSRTGLQQTADKALATYQAMLARGSEFSAETVDHFWTIAEEAQRAADAWGGSFVENADAAAGATKELATQLRGVAAATYEVANVAQQTDWAATYRAAGLWVGESSIGSGAPQPWGWQGKISPFSARAAGGPVAAGSPYMVGERGPELFVPSSAGSILPHGRGGGGSVVTVNIAVNGVFDPATARTLAAVVKQELTREMKTGRKWPSA